MRHPLSMSLAGRDVFKAKTTTCEASLESALYANEHTDIRTTLNIDDAL